MVIERLMFEGIAALWGKAGLACWSGLCMAKRGMPAGKQMERTQIPLTVTQWSKVRRLVEAGESFSAIERAFDVTRVTVRKRAKREGWSVPGPYGAGNGEAATSKSASGNLVALGETDNCNELALGSAFPPQLVEALEQAKLATPEESMAALGKLLQVLLVSNLGALQIRSVRDYATLFDMHRKATGLADKGAGKDGGSSPLVAPMRTLQRRVVEADLVTGDEVDMDDL